MALGIACAGTGSKEAIALIEPMTNDPVNYVRQGALIASALILVQHTEVTCPKVKDFRALYAKVINPYYMYIINWNYRLSYTPFNVLFVTKPWCFPGHRWQARGRYG